MACHLEKENNMSGYVGQEFLDNLRKNPYCGTLVIFDSGCLEDGIPGTPEKEVMGSHVQMESPLLESQVSSSAIDEMQFASGGIVPEENSRTVITHHERTFPTDSTSEELDDFKLQLYSMLEIGSKVLSAQLQSYGATFELDGNWQKEQSETLVPEEKPRTNATIGNKRKLPTDSTSQDATIGNKRKLPTDSTSEEMDGFKSQLNSMLETSSKVLSVHMESHNVNCELNRNQRREHAKNVVCVLGKLADALGKLADKL